jgi:Uma2 family endonuclease
MLLKLPTRLKLLDDDFCQLVAANKDLRLELTHSGELVIMSPTGGETGNRNFDLIGQLYVWGLQNRDLGKFFDSSTGFKLPNGATRSPDASWVEISRWNALLSQERKRFLPLCPDFAIELVSETDDLEDVQAKMQEYIENGLKLGWLINPKSKQVEIYRPGQEVEVLQSPASISGEDILPGFTLDMRSIF